MKIRPLTPELLAKIQALFKPAQAEQERCRSKIDPILPETYAAFQRAHGKYCELNLVSLTLERIVNPDEFNIMSFLLERALAEPSDTWSGRTNDSTRSFLDGKDDALRAVHELLKH